MTTKVKKPAKIVDRKPRKPKKPKALKKPPMSASADRWNKYQEDKIARDKAYSDSLTQYEKDLKAYEATLKFKKAVASK